MSPKPKVKTTRKTHRKKHTRAKETPDFYFDSASAARVVQWFPTFLRFTKGEYAGKPFELTDWQKSEIVEPLFGWKRKSDGFRRYSTLWLEIPKKNTKSTLGSGLAAYLLFGDGEPGAELYSFACDRDQARIIFRQCREMVKGSPELLKRCQVLKDEILVPRTNSFYRVMSKAPATADGINAHAIFFDEIHRQPNRELWDVTDDAMAGRRQPVRVNTTTAGAFVPGHIYMELHNWAKQVEAKPDLDPRWMTRIWAMEDGEDWTKKKVWFRTNPELGKSKKLSSMESAFAKAQTSPAAEINFKRLHLNYITQSSSKLIPIRKWKECGETPLDKGSLIKRDCFAGLDLSISGDLTALILVFPPEPGTEETEYKVLSNFYLPQDNILEKSGGDRIPYWRFAEEGNLTLTPGETIDYSFITEDMKAFRAAYKIREVAYDPWNAHGLATEWANELDLDMVETRMGPRTLNEPTQMLVKIVKEGKLVHGNHPILNIHAANVTAETDRKGNIHPIKESKIDRVDGIVGLIMGLSRVILWQRKPKSVYTSRGLRTL